MRIAVLNSQLPFVWGGAEEMAHHLTRNLVRLGYEAQLVRIPGSWEPPTSLLDNALMNQMLRLDDYDVVVGTKFPNYGIPHRDMRIWLVHQYRQAYDLWDAGLSNIPDTPEGHEIREAIYHYDIKSFENATRLFCVAEPIQQRLKHYMGIEAPLNRVPVNDAELFDDKARDRYIFAGGRVNWSKRQHLLVEAMAYTKSDIRLVVAGQPEDDSAEVISRLIDQHALSDRVTLDLRFVERELVADYMNNALAAAYLPYMEDSVGYVTAEAFLARKPVLTAHDTGGVLDIVLHDETGLVCNPDPREIAAAMDLLAGDPKACRRMGDNGYDIWQARGITWERSIAALLD